MIRQQTKSTPVWLTNKQGEWMDVINRLLFVRADYGLSASLAGCCWRRRTNDRSDGNLEWNGPLFRTEWRVSWIMIFITLTHSGCGRVVNGGGTSCLCWWVLQETWPAEWSTKWWGSCKSFCWCGGETIVVLWRFDDKNNDDEERSLNGSIALAASVF